MKKYVWIVVAVVPLVAAGGWMYAQTANATSPKADATPVAKGGFVCPLTGETLPCAKCCPLNNCCGEATASKCELVDQATACAAGFVCPLTGDVLPCSSCCPLNNCCDNDAASKSTHNEAATCTCADGFICPLTGEELPCSECCPLNGCCKQK